MIEFYEDGYLESCRESGKEAFASGYRFIDCPYKNYSEIDEWQLGWFTAMQVKTDSNESFEKFKNRFYRR